MPEQETSARPSAPSTGRLGKALRSLLMKRATIVASEAVADRFRLVTLESAAFQGIAWMPGQKVQIAMGSGFATRTYTPIEWNRLTGRTCILGYAHGDGPGSAWLLGTRAGDECDVLGPRSSLDPCRLPGAIAIFGDETSIGLAHAVAQQQPDRSVACYLEVGEVESVRDVTKQLVLPDARIFARRGDYAQVDALAAELPALATSGANFVLTGKAGTIQTLRRALRDLSVPASRVVAKAYWAPGKTGLD